MNTYTLRNDSSGVGNLIISDTIPSVEMSRTPDGIRWLFPVEIELHGYEGRYASSVEEPYRRADGKDRERELSWGLRGMAVDLCLREDNKDVHLATSVVPDALRAAPHDHKQTIQFPFYLSAATLAVMERVRLDGDLELAWYFSAETFWLARDMYGYRSTVCQPYSFRTGRLIQRVSRAPWINALRELGVEENILVESPLFREPGGDWRGVWENLVAARRNFDKGMWNGSVRQVRTALERWQAQYREQSKRWVLCAENGQKAAELDKITKRQRLDDLLFIAKRFTDKAAHEGDKGWTRDDALLAITLCTTLWNAIRPHE